MYSSEHYKLLEYKAGYDLLFAQNKLLRGEVVELRQEIVCLKDKLNINSNNSSIPPSSDFKKPKKERKPSDKKRGGQAGHKGKSRSLLDESSVSKFENILPISHCECGGELEVDYDVPHRVQKFEIPRIAPEITEYRMHLGKCKCCGIKYRAALPKGVGYNMLGPRAMSFLGQLSSVYNVTRSKACKVFKEWFGIDISIGCISESEGRVSDYVEDCYEDLKLALMKQSELNADETGHKECGKKHYGWIFTNKNLTFLTLETSRGKKVLRKIFPEGFEGDVTSDRYAAYNEFALEKRQVCWAHLVRDFTRFSGSANQFVSKIGKGLLYQATKLFKIYHKYKNGDVSNELFLREICEIKKRVGTLIYIGRNTFGAPQLNRFCANIDNLSLALWNFAYSQGRIEPTNNLAERDLRKFVIWRKISFGSQSERGSRFMERMISISATCAKQGLNFSEFLQNATTSFLLGTPKTLSLS